MRAASSQAIVMITQLKPISAIFNLPRQDCHWNAAFAKGALAVDALRSDNDAVIDHGLLKVVDNQVDQTTGTVKLKAEFPNTDLQLWPGQFVNVRLLIDTLKQVVVIPTGAVQRGPNGTFVYIIKDDNTAAVRPIVVQKQDETQTVVKSGLEPNDRVVTTGFVRLTDGSKVSVGSADAAIPTQAHSRAVNVPTGKAASGGSGAAAIRGLTHSNERIVAIHSPADRHFPPRRRGDAGRFLGYWWLPVSALPQVDFRPSRSPPNYRVPIPIRSLRW